MKVPTKSQVPLIELLHIATAIKEKDEKLFNAILGCIAAKRQELYKDSSDLGEWRRRPIMRVQAKRQELYKDGSDSETQPNVNFDPQGDSLHLAAKTTLEKGMSSLGLTPFSIDPLVLETAAIYAKQARQSCYIRDIDFCDLPSFCLEIAPPQKSMEVPSFVFCEEALNLYGHKETYVFPSSFAADEETFSKFKELSKAPKARFAVNDSIDLKISGLPKDVLSRLKESDEKIFEVFSLEKTEDGIKESYFPKSTAEVEKAPTFSPMPRKTRIVYRYLPHSELTLKSVKGGKAVFNFEAEQAFSLATESENKTYLVIYSMDYSVFFSYPYPFAIIVEKPKITGKNSTSAHWVGTSVFSSADKVLKETKVTLTDDVARELARDYLWLTMEPIENIVRLDCI